MLLKNIVLFSLLLCLGACSSGGEDASRRDDMATPTVAVVNYPLQYFAERIGGEFVDVVFPVPDGIDPAFWTPSPEDISALQQADLILLNGAGYDKWAAMVSLPTARVINTSAAFAADYIAVQEEVTHTHGPEGEHSHAGTAFTTWLDFSFAAKQALAVGEAMARRWPEHSTDFETTTEALMQELQALDDEVSTIVAGKRQPLVASHPVYQYFARRYGVNMQSVLWEPDAAPSEVQWRELGALLARVSARWMVWEAEPLPATARRLRDAGVETIVFDPCGARPASGDFMAVMRANLDALQRAYAGD